MKSLFLLTKRVKKKKKKCFTFSDHEGELSRKGDTWSHDYETATKISCITRKEYKLLPSRLSFSTEIIFVSFFMNVFASL